MQSNEIIVFGGDTSHRTVNGSVHHCVHMQQSWSWDDGADLMNEKSSDTIPFPAKAAVAIVILTAVIMQLFHFTKQWATRTHRITVNLQYVWCNRHMHTHNDRMGSCWWLRAAHWSWEWRRKSLSSSSLHPLIYLSLCDHTAQKHHIHILTVSAADLWQSITHKPP